MPEGVREIEVHYGIAAHPNIAVPSIRWDFGLDFAEMHGIEVWNGVWTGTNAFANQSAVSRWHQLLVAGTLKPAVGNSDTHRRSQPIGQAQTVVRAESLSVEAIMAGYGGGHSYLAVSSAVEITEFTATLGAVTGECGDRVPSDVGDQVAVRLAVTGIAGCVATLLGPTSTFGTATADDSGQLVLEATVPGGTAFVRSEVRRVSLHGAMVALTNPIFLTAAG